MFKAQTKLFVVVVVLHLFSSQSCDGFRFYVHGTGKKIASVTSEEITQINDEAVPENTKKATKFGFAVFECNSF